MSAESEHFLHGCYVIQSEIAAAEEEVRAATLVLKDAQDRLNEYIINNLAANI